MSAGLRAFLATGARKFYPYLLGLLTEAHGLRRDFGAALQTLATASTQVHETGERFWESELYRVKGESLLAQSAENRAAAETCFRQSIRTARDQGARSLELRAVVSRARLSQQEGDIRETRQALAEICGSFTEGAETRDLRQAKALLASL